MRSVTNLQNDKLFVNQSRAPSTGPIDSDERALLDRFSALLDEIASKVVRMGQQHSAGLSDVPEQSVTPPPAEVMTTELPSPLQSDQPDIVQSEEQSESSEPEMLAEELERDTGLQQLEREGQGAELAVDTVDTLQQTEQPAVPDDVSSISSNVVSVQTAAMVNLEPKFQSSGESSLAVKSELTPLEVFVASDSADHNPNPNFAKKRPILTNPTELARSIAEAEVESPVTEWRELSPDIQFAIRELVQRKQADMLVWQQVQPMVFHGPLRTEA